MHSLGNKANIFVSKQLKSMSQTSLYYNSSDIKYSLNDSICKSQIVCVSGAFGFADDVYGCPGHKCDRDSVCLKKARTLLHTGNHTIEIQR